MGIGVRCGLAPAACALSTATSSPCAPGPPPPPGALPPLKIGQVTSWLLRRAEDLDPRDQQMLTEIRPHCIQLDRLAGHVTSFARMIDPPYRRTRPPGWLEQVHGRPELHTFTAGIRQDLAAVTAGLTLP